MTDTHVLDAVQAKDGARLRAFFARYASPLPIALAAVLLVAALLRFYRLFAGIPYAVAIDEPAIIDRVLRMERTGDLNPHFFDYPTLVFYIQAAVGLLRYGAGLVLGEWRSVAEMDAAALYPLGRVVAAGLSTCGVYFTYRAGKELHSPWTGVLAATLLAVYPHHVRESHYVLTDVPATTFATLALWLAFRAARVATLPAFALAGAAAGLAAASKYNGGFVIVAVVVVALACLPPRRGVVASAVAVAAMAAVFVVLDPWMILDRRGFGDGFAALVGRFEQPRQLAEAPWLTYLKHLGRVAYGWLLTAAAGAILALLVGPRRRLFLALTLFAGGYYAVLSLHPPVFARYALPLVPAVCIAVAFAIVRGVEVAARYGPGAAIPALLLAAILTLSFVGTLGHASAGWLMRLRQLDPREMAAEWLRATAPRGSRVAVENFGPTNLDHAGFEVTQVGALLAQPAEWYRANRYEYLVMSWTKPADAGALLANGTIVFRPVHASGQLGPDLLILQLR